IIKPLNVGIASTVLPDCAERISPCLLDYEAEERIARAAAPVKLTQGNRPAEDVGRIRPGVGSEAVVAIHTHIIRAGRKRNVGQKLGSLAVGRGVYIASRFEEIVREVPLGGAVRFAQVDEVRDVEIQKAVERSRSRS